MRILAMFLSLFFAMNLFGQTREELIEEFRRERAKMMEEIMKMFQDDFSGPDKFFDDMDMDSLFDGKSFSGGGSNVSVEEKYEADGSIAILITPKNENVNLDIQTTENMITIKSETKVEQIDEDSGNQTKSYSMSSFTKSIGIPNGYVAGQPTQEGKSIKILLTPKDKMKSLISPKKSAPKASDSKKVDKIPLGKRPGEETL